MFRAYCSRTSITEHLMISFLALCVQGPLFLYLAYQSVHEPLQVPQRYLEQYKDIRDKHRRTYAGNAASIDRPISADRKISAVRHPTDKQTHTDRDRQADPYGQRQTGRCIATETGRHPKTHKYIPTDSQACIERLMYRYRLGDTKSEADTQSRAYMHVGRQTQTDT